MKPWEIQEKATELSELTKPGKIAKDGNSKRVKSILKEFHECYLKWEEHDTNKIKTT